MSAVQASLPGSSDRSSSTFIRSQEASRGSAGKLDEDSEYPSQRVPERAIHPAPNGHRTTGNYRHGHRTSGSFLLDPARPPSRLEFLPRSKYQSSKSKGKSRRDVSGLIVPKRRLSHAHRSSIGSSPLATKVSTLEDEADGSTGSPAVDGPHPRRSRVSESNHTDSTTLQDDTQTDGTAFGGSGIGYDTDPMQIVNMALSLSDGRRRQASGIRLASADSGYKRSISTGHGTNMQSLGQYLNSERKFSRNISPNAQASGQLTSLKMYKAAMPGGSYLHSNVNDDALMNLEEGLYDVSNATRTRAQKAKDHLELLYEYRRLLSHLPPLRGLAQTLGSSEMGGRTYNPLQYARNRKVRFQEKRPAEGDADGWHDVQQVRAWVNAIIEGHTDRRTDPDECIRLPELPLSNTETIQEHNDPLPEDLPGSTNRKRDLNPSMKPRWPRSDWVVSPGDLLADVYWLEQGLNKTKLEDRDGNQVYPWNTELKFTGWRNRTPAHEQGHQQASILPKADDIHEPKHSLPLSAPQLPRFLSTGRKGRRRGRALQRERKAEADSASERSDSGSQKKRKRLRTTLFRPLSRSTSSDSDDEKDAEEPPSESRALDHYLRQLLDDDPKHSRPSGASRQETLVGPSRSMTSSHARQTSGVSSSKERASSNKRRGSDHRPGSPHDSHSRRRQSRPSREAERPARSSLEYDSTAPSSPSTHQFPSIAINLSPPPSRSPSPTKKVLHSLINPFRDRTHSKQRDGIDAADFADPISSPSVQKRSGAMGKEALGSNTDSSDTVPIAKPARLTSDPTVAHRDFQRHHSTLSKVSSKSPHSPDAAARIRGIFKGGRIAELVGNEVTRVGDFIWKRDPPSASRTSSSASSVESHLESDVEERPAKDQTWKRLPLPHSGRTSTSADGLFREIPAGRPQSASGEKPAYFISNLPNFTSPFQKDRELQEERGRAVFLTPDSSPPQAERTSDHISRAAALHRSVSRSPRLDRLAPPKLTISRPTSPLGSPQGRRGSYGFGGPLTDHALSRPPARPQTTGLRALDTSNRSWQPSSRAPFTEHAMETATRKDIARARALLLSSSAKAREISLRALEFRPEPLSPLLQTTQPHSPSTLSALRVPRKDQHVLAINQLVSDLINQSTVFRTCIDHFSSTTGPGLQTSLQGVDDLVENMLTPRVRVAADESGELSMKLTTTSTLAVKDVNDVIDSAMRRKRRGPVRWLRRFGYGIVEWLVVGLLWAIWLVVSLVNVLVGMGRGSCRLARWLLWLD